MRKKRIEMVTVILVTVALLVVVAGLTVGTYILTTRLYDKETFLSDDFRSSFVSLRWKALHNYRAEKVTARERLLDILECDPSVLVRSEALMCICRNFPDAAADAVRKAYASGIPFLMREAVYAIGEYSIRSCKDVVQDALKSRDGMTVALAESVVRRFSEWEGMVSSSAKNKTEDDECGSNEGGGNGKGKP